MTSQSFCPLTYSGKVYIHRLAGILSLAMTLQVTRSDTMSDEDLLGDEELSGQYKRALSLADNILDSLERRSKAWEGVDFIGDVELTRGGTLGVNDPFFGVIGLSFTLEITCTAQSLLTSWKKREAAMIAAQSQVKNTSGLTFNPATFNIFD